MEETNKNIKKNIVDFKWIMRESVLGKHPLTKTELETKLKLMFKHKTVRIKGARQVGTSIKFEPELVDYIFTVKDVFIAYKNYTIELMSEESNTLYRPHPSHGVEIINNVT